MFQPTYIDEPAQAREFDSQAYCARPLRRIASHTAPEP